MAMARPGPGPGWPEAVCGEDCGLIGGTAAQQVKVEEAIIDRDYRAVTAVCGGAAAVTDAERRTSLEAIRARTGMDRQSSHI
jgi:hypothetical protein